jgi:hypothetical protein
VEPTRNKDFRTGGDTIWLLKLRQKQPLPRRLGFENSDDVVEPDLRVNECGGLTFGSSLDIFSRYIKPCK